MIALKEKRKFNYVMLALLTIVIVAAAAAYMNGTLEAVL